MNLADLDFHLPAELIAQEPAAQRAASRLLHYRRSDRALAHRTFSDLPGLLRPGDLLVFNDARVTPARFYLRKPTGGRVEGLFLAETTDPVERSRLWTVLLKNLGPASPAQATFVLEGAELPATLDWRGDEGFARLRFSPSVGAAEPLLERVGRMPLPPYIKRDKHLEPRDALDRERYQTVYARPLSDSPAPAASPTPTAGPDVVSTTTVAAPTAGLHFTPELLADLAARGIERAFVTLHVGIGTFRPVTADTLEAHRMHVEAYTLPEAAADAINRTRRAGGRIVAVGTTTARVLESQPPGELRPVTGQTGIFIYPPYQWKHVGALITNFHLPRSTLIALVAAWVGLEEQRRIYTQAIEHRYRFFSYGDSSFLE